MRGTQQREHRQSELLHGDTLLAVLHYGIDDDVGEAWSPWSYLQLFGFGILVTGVFTYNRLGACCTLLSIVCSHPVEQSGGLAVF